MASVDQQFFFSPSEDKPMMTDENSSAKRGSSKAAKSVSPPPPSSLGGGGMGGGGGNAGRKRQRKSSPEAKQMAAAGVGEPEDEGEKKVRYSAKSFWLTYSALFRGELTHQRILAMLMSKGELAEYSIGLEHHKEESVGDPNRDEHFHVYVAFQNKKEFKSCRYFDMRSDGTYGSRNLHCNIDTNKTKEDRINRINYTMKEDQNPLQKLNGPLGGAMSKQETYHELNKMVDEGKSVDDCMQHVLENQPEEFFKFGDAIERRLVKLIGVSHSKQFKLSHYRGIKDG